MKLTQFVAPLAIAALAGFSTQTMAAVDAAAAQALFKKNDCTKCHSVDKTKKGPSLQKIAANHKGKADGQDKVIKAMTTGPKVKLDDGSQEDHKVLDSKDAAVLKNMADWILSQ
ncbi:MAG: c-type cytochrome [Rhodoferax sp.]